MDIRYGPKFLRSLKKLSQELKPIAIGDGVKILEWSANSRYVTVSITSPKPSTREFTVDTLSLPEYPYPYDDGSSDAQAVEDKEGVIIDKEEPVPTNGRLCDRDACRQDRHRRCRYVDHLQGRTVRHVGVIPGYPDLGGIARRVVATQQ